MLGSASLTEQAAGTEAASQAALRRTRSSTSLSGLLHLPETQL